MLNLNKLKNELVGFEVSCLELDNKLVESGFYSEFDSYNDELIDSKCVCYTSTEDTEEGIMIDFEVAIEVGEDEVIIASELKVVDIKTR